MQPYFNPSLLGSNPCGYQGPSAGLYEADPGPSHQPPISSLAPPLIDREPASAAHVSVHRQYGPEGNHIPSPALAPAGSATQMLYGTPSPADTVTILPGPFNPNVVGQTWSVAPSYHELTGGVPLSPVSGEAFLGVQSTTTYKPPAKQLSPCDRQRRVYFAPNHKILPSIASPAPAFISTFPRLFDPPIHDTGVPAQTPSHDDRDTSLFQPCLNSAPPAALPLIGYFDQGIPQNCSPPAFPPFNQTFYAVDPRFAYPYPVNAMPDQHHEPNSCVRYVNIIPTSDYQAMAMSQAPPADLSDVDEIVVVDKYPDNVPGVVPGDVPSDTKPSPRERPFGSPSQNSSVVDLSCLADASPNKAKPQGSPPRSFVNLSLRDDGHLYNERKRVDVTDIIAHSFEEPSERKQRGQLTKEQRESTGRARKMRACFRCHSQRIRVSRLFAIPPIPPLLWNRKAHGKGLV